MTTPGTDLSGLGWILDENILRLPHTLRALVLSADGLTAASSEGVDRDLADRMAAAVSGMQSLSREAAEFANCQDDPWELTMIQYAGGFIFTMAAGPGTYLVVAATQDADVEAVSYAMEKAVDRLGHEMNLPARDVEGNST
ncbi:roadblock/LC7 domain-containing protein [Streptomyces sp. 7N604]|uniref:roadblock/LC7 domain-containing protein n=1 Tax=Streptomyces sp. 7N604 TaxID=3457415 RepID=UPI003FD00E7F